MNNNKKEIKIKEFTYIVENEIVTGIKAPAPEGGLAHALKNIGMNISNIKGE